MIEIDSSIINPEQLLERVRKNVLNKGITEANRAFSSPINAPGKPDGEKAELSDIDIRITEMIKTAQSYACIELFEPITSDKKIIGPIIVFIKRVIRKLTRWYLTSLATQQMRFNDAVVRSLNELNKKI